MILPENRLKLLKEKIQEKGFVRIMEAHNGVRALVAESAELLNDSGLQLGRGTPAVAARSILIDGKPD